MHKHQIPKNPFLFGFFASKPYKKWAVVALSAVFIATLFSRLNVIALRNLTDSISAQPTEMHAVWLWALGYALLFFASECFWRMSGFSGMRWFVGFRAYAYQSLYDYLTLHSKDYFNNRFAGALGNKISNAVEGSEFLFEAILWRFIPLILGLFWYTVFASMSSPWLGFITGSWSICFLVINILFARKLQPRSFNLAKSTSNLKGKIIDSLSNISLVHEYAYIAGERDYIKKYVKKQYDAGLARWSLSEWTIVINGFLLFLFMLLMIGTSVYLFQHKAVSVGSVIMVIAIVGVLVDKLLFLGQDIRDAAKYYGEANEGLEEILSEHIVIDAPDAIDFTFTKGAITISSISFEYENAKIFKDFSLTIPAGQKVGIVGRSGAGKTTFVSLLLRHFDVQKGEIAIDDKNIFDVKLESLRRAIAFVPQDTSLFHRTILENIRYSNPESSDREVRRAAQLAQADKFIKDLPEGYNTMVGERGIKLSGGQRQRIAIARAFLKDSPILILDEATSSLDSESEQAIQISLDELMKDKTVIAIAHRLSTLKKMDRIIILEHGNIVEDGLPDELLKKSNGIFKKMWDHQIKGFIIDD